MMTWLTRLTDWRVRFTRRRTSAAMTTSMGPAFPGATATAIVVGGSPPRAGGGMVPAAMAGVEAESGGNDARRGEAMTDPSGASFASATGVSAAGGDGAGSPGVPGMEDDGRASD